MSYGDKTILAMDMLKQRYPTLLQEAISYKGYRFQVFLWDKHLWLRCSQLTQALGKPEGYCTSWKSRHIEKLTEKNARTPSIGAVDRKKNGRCRKQKSCLLSLDGVVMLMNIIGTPAAIDMAIWASVAIEQYDYLIDEKKPA